MTAYRPFCNVAPALTLAMRLAASLSRAEAVRIGWSTTDITPDRPAVLDGMPWARTTTGVMDPLTATALALETTTDDGARESVILVSCDLRSIRNDLREALRRELGSGLFVLPQCSAAGDQDTNILWDVKAENRMRTLAGRTQRQEIAERLTQAVTSILPLMARHIDTQPALAHRALTVSATQTFVVQLASGAAGHLPTARSVAGGAYGAVPASTNVGLDGGRLLVETSLALLNSPWEE